MTRDLAAVFLALAPLSQWGEASRLIRVDFANPTKSQFFAWAERATQAFGGSLACIAEAEALFVGLVAAIKLVDDLLDDEPEGHHQRLGPGRLANLAMGIAAGTLRLTENLRLDAERRAAIQCALLEGLLGTCQGQEEDALGARDEAGYWRIVEQKTGPLFAAALKVGALYAKASQEQIENVATLAGSVARLIQIGDDLHDALAVPAASDWQRPHGNLLLHFALAAQAPQGETFARLAIRVAAGDEAALVEAQEILEQEGAVAYGLYAHLQTARAGAARAAALALPNGSPLVGAFEAEVERVRRDLRSVGIASPF